MIRDLGRASLPRCLLVWLSVSTAALLLGAWLLPDLARAPAGIGSGAPAPPFDVVLVWLCEATGLLGAAWLWLVATLIAGDAVRGRVPRPRTGVPDPLRRALLAACGIALVGGLTVPTAGSATATPRSGDGTDLRSVVAGLALPDRATALSRVGQVLARLPVGHRTVVVRRGDTLWDLARQSLPRGVDDAALSARWRQIYAANRAVIGEDPDLIYPDQQLRVPRR